VCPTSAVAADLVALATHSGGSGGSGGGGGGSGSNRGGGVSDRVSDRGGHRPHVPHCHLRGQDVAAQVDIKSNI
jgi:hypothetical protein